MTRTQTLRQNRIEDLQFMAATGASYDEAAHRLGLTPSALERWLYRNKLQHLIPQFNKTLALV